MKVSMKKSVFLGLLLLLPLLLSACNAPWGPAQAGASGGEDPNIGGGRAVVVGPAQMPTPSGTAIPIKQSVQPGSVVSTGSLTFTLVSVETQSGQTRVMYQVQGLPKNFVEGAAGSPWIVLPGGEIILALEGQGGGSPTGGAATEVQFTALPPNTRSFTLVLPNTWTGSTQTWYIPVRMN